MAEVNMLSDYISAFETECLQNPMNNSSKLADKDSMFYFVGHRHEDRKEKSAILPENVLHLNDLKMDAMVGISPVFLEKSIVSFLKQNFQSGYIIFFENGFNISIEQFRDFFLGVRKSCFLTSIYNSTNVNNILVISNKDSISCKVRRMLFTEFGETSISVLNRNLPATKRLC